MRSILLLFLFFWGFNLHAQVEKQVFRIVHNNKNIGVLYAKKNLLDDKIIYSNRTEINTRILTKIQVHIPTQMRMSTFFMKMIKKKTE